MHFLKGQGIYIARVQNYFMKTYAPPPKKKKKKKNFQNNYGIMVQYNFLNARYHKKDQTLKTTRVLHPVKMLYNEIREKKNLKTISKAIKMNLETIL